MKLPDVHTKALWFLAAALSVVGACGPVQDLYKSIDVSIANGDYASAAQDVRKQEDGYGDKSQVLYNLDLGLLYHYAGVPDSSTPRFFAAERLIQDLYTKSVSLAAASFVINDNLLPYEGEDFEKALINVFLALNYAEQGQGDEALVEARKVDLKLREISRQYEGKNTYTEDAFIRYIAGVLYESSGEINDAFISYRNSYETYKTYLTNYGTRAPSFLLDDLVRTATLMAFTEEAATYTEAGGKRFDRKAKPQGSLVVVCYVGKGPVKQQVTSKVSIPDADGIIHTFQIALPKFVPRYTGNRTYAIAVRNRGGVASQVSAVAEVSENVTAIAGKTLQDRLGMIYLKSGGRAVLKFLAAEKAKAELKKNDNSALNIFGSIAIDLFISATEQADLRTWRTLPAEFHLARLDLDPGDYNLTVQSSDGKYSMRDVQASVKPGKASFVIVEDLR